MAKAKRVIREETDLEGLHSRDGIEPMTEIVIQIGNRNGKNGCCVDTERPVRVFINGKRIEHLRGFKFRVGMNKAPVMSVEKYPIGFSQGTSDQHNQSD